MVFKKSWFTSIFILLSTFLVGCSTDSLGEINFMETLISIGNLGFLEFGDAGPVAGFLRIIIFVLIFALLYEGGQFLGLSKNVRITVSIVLAILSVIFIPATILIAIGTAYGTLMAFILIGAVIFLAGFALHLTPKTNNAWRTLRVVLIGLMIYILGEIKVHAIGLITGTKPGLVQGLFMKIAGGGAPIALQRLTEGITQYATWGIWILTVLLVIEGLGFFAGGAVGRDYWDKFTGWHRQGKADKAKSTQERNAKLTTLNEYLLEKQELESLEDFEVEVNKFKAAVDKVISKGKFKNKAHIKSVIDGFNLLMRDFSELTTKMSKLGRATFRADMRLKQYSKWLVAKRDKTATDVRKVLEPLEKEVFTKNAEVFTTLGKARREMQRIAVSIADLGKYLNHFNGRDIPIEDLKLSPARLGQKLQEPVNKLSTNLSDLGDQISYALSNMEAAYRSAKNLVVRMESLDSGFVGRKIGAGTSAYAAWRNK